MTKSIKQKKELKRDFKKKKVKLGKTLKRAQNETKTEFKARKLILREQLEERPEFEFLNRRKLSIQEILVRLSHNNDRIRQDAMKRLKGALLEQSKAELLPHLPAIIKTIMPCSLDADKIVRREGGKNIELLIKKMGCTLEPYFHIISSYVCCSMVHINENVRMDSLFVMDVLITGLPAMIAKSADSLLNNYLSLISKKIKSSQTQNMQNLIQHSDPTSQTASIEWRIKLLGSLSRYLGAILSERRKLIEVKPKSTWEIILKDVFRNFNHCTTDLKILSDVQALKEFCERLVPILFVMWVEVLSDVKNLEDNPLPATGAKVLGVILKILAMLIKLTKVVETDTVDMSWFENIVTQDFRSKLMVGFPYSVSTADQCNVANVNLPLCTFALHFARNNEVLRKKIVTYLTELMQRSENDGQYNTEEMVGIVCDIIGQGNGKYKKQHERLLSAVLSYFNRQKTMSKNKSTLLRVPLRMTDHECFYLRDTDVSTRWIKAILDEANTCGDDCYYDILDQLVLRAMPKAKELISEHFAV